jgi:hypothetical protein
MKITEYWATLVAVGLAHKFKNVEARLDINFKKTPTWFIKVDNGGTSWCNWQVDDCELQEGHKIVQLRKDGKDLYKLEWRKPTLDDVGKMCWFSTGYGSMELAKLKEIKLGYKADTITSYEYNYCLLADHGQVSPTEADFKRIYGEQND